LCGYCGQVHVKALVKRVALNQHHLSESQRYFLTFGPLARARRDRAQV
jgi:hypothetical protein